MTKKAKAKLAHLSISTFTLTLTLLISAPQRLPGETLNLNIFGNADNADA
jgi:hypothetical protein